MGTYIILLTFMILGFIGAGGFIKDIDKISNKNNSKKDKQEQEKINEMCIRDRYGKEYPNRVTMGAMIDFKRETGKDVNEIGADMELLTMFMFCCVRSACRADEVTFDLGFERFADGIDLSEFNRFQESMVTGGEDGSKKKGQERKL